MDLRNHPFKVILDRFPIAKRFVKVLMTGALVLQDRQSVHRYSKWLESHDPTTEDLVSQREKSELFAERPLISIITPTYNTPEKFFREMVDSVLGQTYKNWELIIVDDASPDQSVKQLILEYAEQDNRIKYIFLSENHHIAGATNEAIKIASGEFISLFDHDDILRPNALFEIASALNIHGNLDFIYTDEDKVIGESSRRQDPFFKPDWNPDFLHAVNYITHFTTIRKSVLDSVGYEDPAYNGAQDWELFLRVTRNIPEQNIYHIPKILYSWRVHDNSTAKSLSAKPYVVDSQRKAIEHDLYIKGESARVVQDEIYSAQWRVDYAIEDNPKVLLVLLGDEICSQQAYIRAHTAYSNFDILCVKSGVRYADLFARLDDEFIVLLDHMVNIRNQDWIQLMLSDAKRNEVGFVVADYGRKEKVAHSLQGMIEPDIVSLIARMSVAELSMHMYRTTRYNTRCVLGGICMVRINKVHGVISDTSMHLDITELGLLLSKNGYRHLYNPYVKMIK